jgi:hypothetical protein
MPNSGEFKIEPPVIDVVKPSVFVQSSGKLVIPIQQNEKSMMADTAYVQSD